MIEKAKNYILDFINQQNNHRLSFHSYAYSEKWVNMIHEIGNADQVEHNDILSAQLAAIFALGAMHAETMEPNILTKAIAEEFFITNKTSDDLINKVFAILNTFYSKEKAKTKADKLFLDSKKITTYTNDFDLNNALQKLEWELLKNKDISTSEWAQLQLQKMVGCQLELSYSKTNFDHKLAQNIIELKKTVTKNYYSTPESDLVGKFQKLEKKLPLDAVQTFFRTNYRNHINLSSIADKKANIMISVNAIIISVLISILSYQNITERNPMLLMPVVIFLIAGLSSLMFAVLSARPKVTRLNTKNTSPEDVNKNIVFFGNFVHLSVEEYEDRIDAMFRNSQLIYGNLTRDLYYLGKVLDKKYRYLTVAYNIFMVGFGATVITFLIALFLN